MTTSGHERRRPRDCVVRLVERGAHRCGLVPYLDPYESCLMCLMRLLDVLAVRG
jgi:hypothetical protein